MIKFKNQKNFQKLIKSLHYVYWHFLWSVNRLNSSSKQVTNMNKLVNITVVKVNV